MFIPGSGAHGLGVSWNDAWYYTINNNIFPFLMEKDADPSYGYASFVPDGLVCVVSQCRTHAVCEVSGEPVQFDHVRVGGPRPPLVGAQPESHVPRGHEVLGQVGLQTDIVDELHQDDAAHL